MDGMNPSLAAVARRQMALFTLDQALEAGFSLRQIQQRRETGCWDQVHAGVYRVAGAPDSWQQRLLAACLAAGCGAVASHRSASQLWGLTRDSGVEAEIWVLCGHDHRLDGVVVHRPSDLTAGAITRKDGVPVTTAVRTLVDLGGVQRKPQVEGALDVAVSRRLVTLDGVRAGLDLVARRGRRGAGVLRSLLDERSAADGAAESVLEARTLRLCRRQGLPEPVCQHEVYAGRRLVGRIDFAYPEHRVAIEVDGYESHTSLQAFRRDRDRQNRLVAMGWTVLRFTWDDVVHDPTRVARAITNVLGSKSNTGC